MIVLAAFLPVLSNGWVSWDDPEALVDNDALRSKGLFVWALTTEHLSHFQPLSWVVWAASGRNFGWTPETFHGLSVLVHVLNAIFLYLLIFRLSGKAVAALLGALLYAVHPLRVEVVAWASAFPYLLSTAFLLGATLLYLRSRLALSVLAYGASLLARPVALAFPLLLIILDILVFRRKRHARFLAEKIPFLVLSAAGLLLEGSRRPFLDLERFGLGARLTLAADSLLAQLSRSVWPVRLTPLDPLPIEPRVDWLLLGLGSLVLLTSALIVWHFRSRHPAALAVWASWLLLALPSLGLAPSGLQATADRYTYVPALALAVGLGGLLMRSRVVWRWVAVAAMAALSVATYRQSLWWRDSLALWGRAVELDPENDLALYFYASALSQAAKADEAIESYGKLLQLEPDHGPARADLANLLTREADARAGRGELESAVGIYDEALALSPGLASARENRAMAFFELGRYEEALSALRAADEEGMSRPEIAGALAVLENAEGNLKKAVFVLDSGLERFPDDLALTHNLARLLATRPDAFPDRRREAVDLAERVVARTERRDPRALDTLAMALAVDGSGDEARRVFEEASRLALAAGNEDLAREIEEHARALSR